MTITTREWETFRVKPGSLTLTGVAFTFLDIDGNQHKVSMLGILKVGRSD